ncbi:MAG: UvrD-helicase domain-containing protein, partial [Burkholderiaceae bacterium]|nr:UvrD-helicase domain-containing protein [Burkholderiaceae bacterium]
GNWRARFSKSEGFPAFASAAPFKQRIGALTDTLRSNEELRQALHGLRDLPAPHFTAAQWGVLEAIVGLLPRAAAELMLVFGDTGESDFVQLTRAAVDALGDEGTAADIAHALDARIRHLLIDEFQDTSITQFELIERLVADWQPGDGRTVFVVGDPMQSIYRFREAEVGLFLRAWTQGIARLPLQRLQLARNFRSQQALVDWANGAFVRVLPDQSDIASGAVAFEPSVANQSSDNRPPPAVQFHTLLDGTPSDEAARVVQLVRSVQTHDPVASIALLVRARSHLAQIVPALREAELRFTAVELELLLARPLIGDLLALTRALEHLADKVAWLAVLRAPWCGLTLADLSTLAEGAPNATVWQLLGDRSRGSQLSADGVQRLERVLPVLARALELRGRSPLTERVRDTWSLLGGPACISTPADHTDSLSFFDHLAQHEERSRGVPDIAAFELSLVRLYAAPDTQASDRLQVMTIHKAKGLEFDYVIVPGLDRVPPAGDPQLMQWLERATRSSEPRTPPELILSPIYPPDADKKNDSIYCWIERLQQQRQAHEDGRVLYVAATRARKQLDWLACVPTLDSEILPPRENSLLQRLWPAVEHECERALAARLETGAAVLPAPPMLGYDQTLRRLPVDWRFPPAPKSIQWDAAAVSSTEMAVEFSWAGETARRIGIVVHRWLQRIADDASVGWSTDRITAIAPHIERELAAAGISGAELKTARERVAQALTSAMSDPHARWLLGPQSEARSELRLTVRSSTGIKRVVLDRTFVDEQGARWIIDYKTGTHEGSDVEAFLDRERLRYSAQLELYARALGGTAQLGLYFPLLNGWRAWKSANGTD